MTQKCVSRVGIFHPHADGRGLSNMKFARQKREATVINVGVYGTWCDVVKLLFSNQGHCSLNRFFRFWVEEPYCMRMTEGESGSRRSVGFKKTLRVHNHYC